jgi:hypothetical protein
MRRWYTLLAGLTIVAVPCRLPADDSKLAPLERFAGEWVVEGKWSNGETLHARTVYEWGLNKKIMKAQTFVRNGAKEYQRYESIMAWHPEKKSLYEISFVFDGDLHEVLIDPVDKDTLRIGWTPVHEGQPTPGQVSKGNARQVIKFLDDDHFQWIVTIKDGAEWKPLIDATWTRKAK